jgi:perosamine synthetase
MHISMAKPSIGPEEISAVAAAMQSGILASGPRTKVFEQSFAEYIGVPHAIATNSGTAALMVALQALGLGHGDEVITVPFTFIASVNAIIYTGATPVFVDVDTADYNMDPSQLQSVLSPHSRAVEVVHLYGQTPDMEPIMDFCKQNGLLLIEDACQAHGANYRGRQAGSIGDVGCFSFYPTKNMTTGEGGMITTSSELLDSQCRIIRNHGSSRRYYHDVLGYNFRMTDISAAIGIEQLKKLDAANARRQENSRYYLDALRNIAGVILPHVFPERQHAWHQFTLRVTAQCRISRDQLAADLAELGIETAVYYPLPVNQQTWLQKVGTWPTMPVAEMLSREVLSIPVHPGLGETDLQFVADAIRRLCS